MDQRQSGATPNRASRTAAREECTMTYHTPDLDAMTASATVRRIHTRLDPGQVYNRKQIAERLELPPGQRRHVQAALRRAGWRPGRTNTTRFWFYDWQDDLLGLHVPDRTEFVSAVSDLTYGRRIRQAPMSEIAVAIGYAPNPYQARRLTLPTRALLAATLLAFGWTRARGRWGRVWLHPRHKEIAE